MWYSKSDSRHHSGKLVLTKSWRQDGTGDPNQGLVSQQDKRQPSFPHLRDRPFQTTTHCEPVPVSQAQPAGFFSGRLGSHCAPDRTGGGSCPGDLCQGPEEILPELLGMTTNSAWDAPRCQGTELSRQTRRNPFAAPTAGAARAEPPGRTAPSSRA